MKRERLTGEFVIEYIDGNATCTVTAETRKSVNLLRRLKSKYPDQVEIVAENYDGSLLAHCPADWMQLWPPRRLNLSPEQRAARGRALRGSFPPSESGEMREISNVPGAGGVDVPPAPGNAESGSISAETSHPDQDDRP